MVQSSSIRSVGMAAPADGGARLILHLALALGLALIVKLLASPDGELHFDPAVFEIHLRGHQREALLARLAEQLVDFAAVQQELAPAIGLMIFAVAVRILADVGVDQPGFLTDYFSEGVLELNLALARRFHLGSGEGKTGFITLEQMIIVPGVPVITENFDAFRHRFRGSRGRRNLLSTRAKQTTSSSYVVSPPLGALPHISTGSIR